MEFLLAQQAAPQGQGNGLITIIMMVAIFAVFYFLLIRPQQKRQKELQKQIQSVKNGDEVVTTGGIKGRVLEVKEDVVIVESEGTKVAILKPYIAQIKQK